MIFLTNSDQHEIVVEGSAHTHKQELMDIYILARAHEIGTPSPSPPVQTNQLKVAGGRW